MKTELFDRYVHQVGRRLPRSQRADVEQELNSLLLDALEERAEASKEGEEAQAAVLREFGPPAEMAARYRPANRYLIGPRLYDLYWTVVAAVGVALTAAFALLALLAALGRPETLQALGSSLLGLGQAYVSALIGAFGWVTIAFFVLERVLPESAVEAEPKEEWDPRSLPPVEDRARIEVGGVIAEVVFTAIALVVFNIFAEWVGINYWASINGGPSRFTQIPLLAPVFFTTFLPLLNASWILRIGLDLVLLRQGRWQRWTRVADLILAVFGVYIAYRFAFGPDILTFEGIRSDELRELLSRWVPYGLRIAFYLGLFGSVVETIRKLVRVLQQSEAYGRVVA